MWLIEADVSADPEADEELADPDHVRADLQRLLDRRAAMTDEARPEGMERRHRRNRQTARENVAQLSDPGTFVEYGSLVVGAMRKRQTLKQLQQTTPADGIVVGVGSINGQSFGENRSRCAILAYDMSVLAGTQGREGHRKDARIFELAKRLRLPVVFCVEGGGGRPGETERPGESVSFNLFARLSGKVPLVGVIAGYCFGGNAAFAGCCDVIIATRDANIGMGGPAMVEGGGLGVFRPDEIGPATMHAARGVVDILCGTEREAIDVAKRYLSYFQGDVPPKPCPDQRRLRSIVPENRRRAYDIRELIRTLADQDSVLELGEGWGVGVITALIRIDGRAIGVVANNPMHLGGAVDGDGSDKAARFMGRCGAFGLPMLMLCDTPGIMVGPDAETTGLVRRASALLIAGAQYPGPIFTVIVRKAYGIGMLAMMGGAGKAPIFNVAWPTGEYGGMGFEGAVRLGYRKELEQIVDPAERQQFFEEKVEEMYAEGRAMSKATTYDFDEVIDPAQTRQWILHAVNCAQASRGHQP